MERLRPRFSLLLFIITISVSCSRSMVMTKAETPLQKERIWRTADLATNLMVTQKFGPSGIAVVTTNGIFYAQGFGYSDYSKGIPATPDTLYCVGSISKLFTATAIMQLAEKGLIDIDKPVSDYIPEFMVKSHFPNIRPVTVRMLLTHRSGLPSDRMWNFFSGDFSDFRNVISFINNHYLQNPPGLVFNYCNNGYAVLGVLIERVTGVDFYTYIKRQILDPLEMTHSTFVMTNRDDQLCTKSYIIPGYDIQEPTPWATPAGSLWSSPREMANFIIMVLNGGTFHNKRILNADTLKAMFEDDIRNSSLDFGYQHGLGWAIDFHPFPTKGMCISHGRYVCFHSELMILPESGLGVIYETTGNGAGNAIIKVPAKGLDEVFPLLKITNIKPEAKTVIPELNLETNIQKISRIYATSLGLLEIISDGKEVRAEMVSDHTAIYHLKAETNGCFSGYSITKIAFVTVDGTSYVLKNNGNSFSLFGRETIPAISGIDWKKLAGTYHIYNEDWQSSLSRLSGHPLQIELKGKGNLAEIRTPSGKFMLESWNDQEAVIMGFQIVGTDGRYYGSTICRTNINGKDMFELDGYLYEKY